MLTQQDVRTTVENEILALLMDRDPDTEPLSVDDALFEIGLNSLTLAQLLIQLEAEFGVDPFDGESSITDMRTVGDLVEAYERALASAVAG
jgi:acyl carrier protein